MPAQVWSDFIFQFFFIVISYHDLFLSYFLPWRQSPTPRREKGGGRREKGLISYSTFYVLRWNVECRIGSLLPLHDAWEIGKAESCILFSPMAPRLPCLVTFASPPMRHKAPNARGWPEGAESWPTPEPRLASCLGHAPIWGRIGTHSRIPHSIHCMLRQIWGNPNKVALSFPGKTATFRLTTSRILDAL
ncbi:uncharacterized protein F4817DRAFT_140980 [Daldinia loculata]|uniref:uncharacterized protein n=1 Tax=Daldinia loculata TaxID=103429 RepID=UPI0020C4C7D4|nr:uncharacterized protein F4817DRAFT_140980 [Daldinia loculata]KAI1646480.1 hypothetical protein F4817DRAFT_140980 [Daldinia loculata]